MFSLIDSLSFSKKDENNTGVKSRHNNKFKYPSLDTAFLVIVVLITIIIYGLIKLRKRMKKHYRKKYTGVELNEIQTSAPFVPSLKQIY
jgi:hypothetical protein